MENERDRMQELAGIQKDPRDPRKFMKAAFEIANSLARRGYDPKEAVKDATNSVKNTEGYQFTDQQIASLERMVYVHPNFK